jgi:hypothetical protein
MNKNLAQKFCGGEKKMKEQRIRKGKKVRGKEKERRQEGRGKNWRVALGR